LAVKLKSVDVSKLWQSLLFKHENIFMRDSVSDRWL